jgi:WD40 repeat protein
MTAIEINIGDRVHAMAFSANGKSLLSVDREGVRVWGVEDGAHMATMRAVDVKCLAVSKDGKWIAAGTGRGEVFVWDAKTYEQDISLEQGGFINGVDFSPH